MSESIVIALIGVAGAAIGSVATIASQLVMHCISERSEKKRDEPRRALLRQMLEDPKFKWRNLETLMHVIGADEKETKRLLLVIGARASEDGKPLWGLLSKNPLPAERQ